MKFEKMKQLHSKWTKEQGPFSRMGSFSSCYRWLHGRAEKNIVDQIIHLLFQ